MVLTSGANYLARFGTAVVVLVTIPLARSSLDAELFGVWMMLSSLIGFFSFADLGVGNGVLNSMTAAHASADRDDPIRVIVSGYLCTGAVAVTMLLFWTIWTSMAANPAKLVGEISPANRDQVLVGLHAFVALLTVNIPASLVQKAQLASQQGHWTGLSQFAASMATLFAVPAALLLGGSLLMLVLASLLTQVLANVVNSLWWLASSGYLQRLRWKFAERRVVAGLLRAGSMFFVLQLAAAFAFQSDSIVITHVLGQAAYGEFAAVQKLFLLVSALLSAVLIGLWPAVGDAMARGDLLWVKRALRHALLTTVFVAGGLSLALALSIGEITRFWLGVLTPPALALTAALAAWTLVDALGAVSGAFLNGANVLRAQVLIAVALGAIAFGGKWLLTPQFGAAGAVLASLVAYCCISAPAQVFIFRRLLAKPR